MRQYWLKTMLQIANPVLENLAKGNLNNSIPKGFHKERVSYAMLEAFGRTLCGIAPWLQLDLPQGDEKLLQEKYRKLIIKCMDNATNPESPDYMNWSLEGGQPLVDTAFLAHAIVRAPESMYHNLNEDTKKRLALCLKNSRKITPVSSNWLFFSAMVEAALCLMGEQYDLTPVDKAINTFKNWYVGDGTYSDGEFFHWDYYNSFVIHPMQIDILRVFSEIKPQYKDDLSCALKYATRYAQVLERLINPDGTYPVFGRSVAYRFGAFQLLSQCALQGFLPKNLSYAQIRCGLNSVIHKVCENPLMFDEFGWLTPGVYGEQPDLAEGYINIGSLYLCETVFLPLGLSAEHPFWSDENADWTSKKIWSGQNTEADHATD